QKLPYQEKIRILSLLPEDWTYNEIQEKFGCTRHAVNLAKDLRLSTATPLHLEPKKCVIRSHISPALTEHFITWLVETEMLVSIPWGHGELELDSGEVLTIPKQVLQAKRRHVIVQYKWHYEELKFTPLSDRKLFYILENLNASEQKALFGLDDFAVAARDAWEKLEFVCQKLLMSSAELQQNTAKANDIKNLSDDCAYMTIDWAQKILRTEHREGQSKYFGKKGMSVLVGSFTMNNLEIADSYKTETYMLALTRCSQNELDTLSGGHLIATEFAKRHPQIKKLLNRSDNASVLGGHATPESERILHNKLGLELLVRDYSEVQLGKDVSDRMTGSAKMRKGAFVDAGNNTVVV
ncbi:unnamed protein product, partial [Didymodactylos carnosus]